MNPRLADVPPGVAGVPPGGPPMGVAAPGVMGPLATLADVELLYGPLEETDGARVRRLIDVASATVRRFCRQALTLVADDEVVLRSPGTATLVLPERPVLAVDRVAVESAFGPGAGSGEGFTWDSSGRLTRAWGLPWGLRGALVEVTYTHGYDPVPADLVGLVAAKAAAALSGAASNPGGLRSLQTGAMSETYANFAGSAVALGCATLTEDEQRALRAAGYRQEAAAVELGR